MEKNIAYLYLGFIVTVAMVVNWHVDVGLSSFLTLSVGLQFFAFICLHVKVGQGSAAGISMKSLILQVMVYACRLSSTTWLKGYIPIDSTGDYLYQLLDTLTLLVCVRLIYCCLGPLRHTYQDEYDTMDIKPILIGCLVAAVLVHPDLNDRPIFDSLWAASLYVDVAAMAPQLWMMTKVGGCEALTSHYAAAIATSRVVNLIFWYHGYEELAPEDDSANYAGYAIILAHALQILLMADFVVLYLKSGCNRLCGGDTSQKVFVE